MKYLIHYGQSFNNRDHRKVVKELVDSQVKRLEWVGDRHYKPAVVDLYFDSEAGASVNLLAVVNLAGEILYLKEQGMRIDRVIQQLFDRLKLSLNQKYQLERRSEIKHRREVQVRAFQDHLTDLKELKRTEKTQVFKKILRIMFNDVARYIRRRLNSAELTTAVRRGRFKIQELLDELFLVVYEDLEELPEKETAITPWLFQKADLLLAQKFRELEFEKNSFSELEHLVEAEFHSLEESFTIDGEEEIIPVEELDGFRDQEFPDWYAADDLIYEEEEGDLLEDLNVRLDQREIHRQIEKELAKLTLRDRTIMDLYLAGQMQAEEIAGIKEIPLREVEEVIRSVNDRLKERLSQLIETG